MKLNSLSKKLLCLALVFQLILGTCAMGVFAADNEINENEEVVSSEIVDIINDSSEDINEDSNSSEEVGNSVVYNGVAEESENESAELMSFDPSWVKVSDNKPVFASAYTEGNEAYLATDGDASTSFKSAKQNVGLGVEAAFGKMNERFVIDLMQETQIAGIKIQAASGCGSDVLIYAGNDNEFNTKDKIYEGAVSDTAMTEIEAPDSIKSNAYRYVIVEKNDYTKFGISEIEVYSSEADASEVNNVRRVSFGKKTFANNRGGYAGINSLKDNPVNISGETFLGDVATSSEVSNFFFVDLGAEYEIPYVTMSSGIWRYGNTDAANLKWREARTDFDIVGTNDPNFARSDENDVILYHYDGEFGKNATYGSPNEPGVDSGMALFENKDHKSEKFRYIGIRRTKAGSTIVRLVLSTFNVYAGGIMVENFNAQQTDFDKMQISADVAGLNTSNLTALLTAFDPNGDCVGTKATAIDFDSDGNYSLNWDVDFGGGEIASAKLMMINGIDDFTVRWYNHNILGSSGDMPTPTHTVDAEAENVNYQVKKEGADIFIYGNAKYDYLTAMVIKPTEAENYVSFDNLDETNYDSSVSYMQAYEVTEGEPYEFKMTLSDTAPVGNYLVKLFYPDGTSEDVYEFYYFSQSENEAVTALLKDAEASEVLNIINDDRYKEAFKDCTDEIAKCGTKFGEYFVKAREIMAAGTFSGTPVEYTDYAQFKDVIKFASMLNALVERDDYMNYIAKYKNLYMSKVFDNNYNAAKFETVYPIVRDNAGAITTADKINSCIKEAIALGLVYNGSQNDIKTAITDYADYVGVNANTISASGYSALEISKHIPKTIKNITEYSKVGMEDAVKSAIKAVKAEKDKNTTKPIGGGSSGTGNKSYPESVVAPPVVERQPTASFNDLNGFDWAKNAIINLADKKIIQGDGKGNFKPSDNITREEVVKLVVEMFDITTDKSDDLFTDCAVTDWYYPYVMAAKYGKVVKGISSDRFGVGQAVTRQDLATILRRAMAYAKYDFSGNASADFTDEESIEMYAIDGVMTLAAEGIVNGFEDGSFRPNDNTTRAEAAVMIDRVYENYQKQQLALKAAAEEE